jgi:AmmeMemoRadiSam system protein B
MHFHGRTAKLRRRRLPAGWYPDEPSAAASALASWTEGFPRGDAAACVCPHAGWAFSGPIAARSLCALRETAETVIIIGGHLPSGAAPLIGNFEAVEVPGGSVYVDTEFLELLLGTGVFKEDLDADNTVEVLVPMASFLFPEARLLWLRFPASMQSYDLGKELGKTAARLGRDAVVAGSTDLTHYGPNYAFCPQGIGGKAELWVRTVNDAALIRGALSSEPATVLERAERDSSACSAGAVLGALGYAEYSGARRAELVEYGTSADVHPSASFVGYAGIGWHPEA